MCEPTLLVTAALLAGSTVAGQLAQQQVGKARNRASLTESLRQEEFRRQQAAAFADTSGRFTREQQDEGIDRATQAREESLVGNLQALSPGAIPTTGSAPQVVQDNLAKELSGSLAEGKSFAQRLSRLGAFGENQQRNVLDLTRGAQEQARLGGFSRGSSRILPLEFQSANQEGQTARTVSSVLGGLGQVGSLASATGGIDFSKLFGTGTPPIATDAAGRILGGI